MDLPAVPAADAFSAECAQSLRNLAAVVAAQGRTLGADAACCVAFVRDARRASDACHVWDAYSGHRAPLIVVTVPNLPRGAAIEWHATLRDPRGSSGGAEDEDDDEESGFEDDGESLS
ncbi:hypothetical protein HK405_013543 [Cladochytrium tenue]|nr:hypothetical protein HK405_013543 [Cladochytrium tenue]